MNQSHNAKHAAAVSLCSFEDWESDCHEPGQPSKRAGRGGNVKERAMTPQYPSPDPDAASAGASSLFARVIRHAEQVHSPAVTIVLQRAYTYLSAPTADRSSYVLAQACLLPVLSASMSQLQRMHVTYAFAKALVGADEGSLALPYADEAVDLAEQLGDQAALITLRHFRGGLFRTLGALPQAAQDYAECLVLIRSTLEGVRFRGASLELDLLGRLAGLELYLTRYDRARKCLAEGRSMTHAQRENPVARATLEWIQALLDRWSGQPQEALQHGLTALETYSGGSQPLSESRLRVAIADIALDLAKKTPPGTARDDMIATVDKLLAPALELSTEYEDLTGQCLVELARIRMSRVARQVENRVVSLGFVQRTAQRMCDDTLLAEAYTSLAEEYVERHNVLSAQESFRQAMLLAEASAAPAIAVWARLGLHESERGDIGE